MYCTHGWLKHAGVHGVCKLISIYLCAFVGTITTVYTGHFIMFSVITNNYNKKAKGPTIMEFFTATGKLKKFFFFFDN